MRDKTAAALTPRQVRWARKVHAAGTRTFSEIVKRLNASKTAVSFMLNGKTYKHVK